jgi:hypothetical protein
MGAGDSGEAIRLASGDPLLHGARATLEVMRCEGEPVPSPSPWQAQLIGGSPSSHLRELSSEIDSGQPDSADRSGESQDGPRDGAA